MFWTNLLKQFKDYLKFERFIHENPVTNHNSPFSLSSQPRSDPSPLLFQPQLSFLVQSQLCMEIGKQKDLPMYSSSSQAVKLLPSTFRGYETDIPKAFLILVCN